MRDPLPEHLNWIFSILGLLTNLKIEVLCSISRLTSFSPLIRAMSVLFGWTASWRASFCAEIAVRYYESLFMRAKAAAYLLDYQSLSILSGSIFGPELSS